MKKVIIGLAVTTFVFLGILTILRLFVGGGEDTWICQNGQWVEHGHPSASMPTKPCQ